MAKNTKIFIAVAAISFIQGLQIAVSPIVGALAEHYSNVELSLVQMVVTIPSFVSMIFSLLTGWLVLKVSKKNLLIFASVFAGIVGLLPLAIDSFYLLFATRALYGISLGIAATLNTAVVSEFFEGEMRVKAMGVQAACVGTGYMFLSALSGWLAKSSFTNAYYISIIGFISMLVIIVFLPDTGKAQETETEKVRLNKEVIPIYIFVFIEMLLLITFNTNISLHISGKLAGDTRVSGVLTGAFSAALIVVGILLGKITKRAKQYTLPVAMLCFSIGAILIVIFPDNYPMLILAAIFCGISQGIYVPVGYVEASNAVAPVAVALASAGFNAAACVGQTISPFVTNSLAKLIFGEVTTSGVYIIVAVLMFISAIVHGWVKHKEQS